ncbi:MAG: hypothetical protein LWX09_09180, partial [Bacteroidia bacterium]|nr:hypothetical protein [Bacteroidia bacterium]
PCVRLLESGGSGLIFKDSLSYCAIQTARADARAALPDLQPFLHSRMRFPPFARPARPAQRFFQGRGKKIEKGRGTRDGEVNSKFKDSRVKIWLIFRI